MAFQRHCFTFVRDAQPPKKLELPPGSIFRKKKNQILDWEYDIKELFNSTPTTVSLVKNVNETASAFAFRELLKANQIPFDEKYIPNEVAEAIQKKLFTDIFSPFAPGGGGYQLLDQADFRRIEYMLDKTVGIPTIVYDCIEIDEKGILDVNRPHCNTVLKKYKTERKQCLQNCNFMIHFRFFKLNLFNNSSCISLTFLDVYNIQLTIEIIALKIPNIKKYKQVSK